MGSVDEWGVKCGVWSLECEVILGSALCKICSAKRCSRFVKQECPSKSVQGCSYDAPI